MKIISAVLAVVFAVLLGSCGRQCPEGQVAARRLRSTSNNPAIPGNMYEETVCMQTYAQPAFNPPPVLPMGPPPALGPMLPPKPLIPPALPPKDKLPKVAPKEAPKGEELRKE